MVIAASGGNDFGTGHVRDIHFYPQPECPPAETHRASVLGEYGGLGLPLAGHTWRGWVSIDGPWEAPAARYVRQLGVVLLRELSF